MTRWQRWSILAGVAIGSALAASHAVKAQATASSPAQEPTHSSHGPQVRDAFEQALPSMDGSHLKVHIVEVVYGPGKFSLPHSHPCPVIGYVAEGALRTKVKGQPERVYKAGESFYEAPNGVHEVSANASNQSRVKLLAYFVCDHEAPLSAAAPDSNSGGK